MKYSKNKTPLLIVQVEPPQSADSGDYFYRTHAPGVAMAKEEGVYVINLTNQHRKKAEIMSQADVLVLKNICDPDVLPLIKERKGNGKITVYEIADDLGALQPWNPVYSFYKNKENLSLVHRLASSCDALQVSVPELKRLYGHLNDNCEVFLNHILNVPSVSSNENGKGVIIGWGGSHGHMEDMAGISDSLIEWVNTKPKVSLHLMCSGPIWKLFDNLPEHKKKRTLPGGIDKYYNFLKEINIGIGPLKNTAFNRSRSDVKFLEYAASGVVPVMASLEPYYDSVEVGITGFLFKDPDGLFGILDQLVEDNSLLRGIANEARKYVLRERLQMHHGEERLRFYKDLLMSQQNPVLQNCQGPKWFEEWSNLDGANKKGRHLQLKSTLFEDLLYDGLVAKQQYHDKELALQFFEKAEAMHYENYLTFLYGASVSKDPVDYLLKAIEVKPDSIKAWLLLGEEFEKRGNIKEALESYESAVSLCPEYEIPYIRVAALLKKSGEQSQSDWFFNMARDLGPQKNREGLCL